MRRRSRARELAVQFLYHLDLRGPEALGDLDAFLDAAEAEAREDSKGGAPRVARRDAELREFAVRLIEGTRRHRDDADKILAGVTRNWDLKRMAAVDRNVLRLAVYELEHGDPPANVILDEAVELARRFGDDPSPAFVNGVLDAVARSVRPGEMKDASRRPRAASGGSGPAT